MAKKVTLVVEYELGDDFEDTAPTQPEDWKEYFDQADFLPGDIKIVGVRVE